MDKKTMTPPEIPAFSPSAAEKIAAFCMYPAAYFYGRFGTSGWGLPIFALIFTGLTELINRGRKRPAESWVWLGCLWLVVLSISFHRARAWGDVLPYLFAHLFAVWWVMSRSGRLMAGISGPLLLLDGLNAFIIFPFRNFFLRLRTVWFTLTHISKRERARPGTVILTAGALLAALLLFTASAGLLISADAGFAALMSGFESLFRFRLDDDALFTLLISLPIGAYLFGLIAGSAREDEARLRGRGEAVYSGLAVLRRVPNSLWVGIAGLFCLLYLAFFLVQARYLFGAFTRTLPDGFIVSQYARQGFFELCQVMAVNFLLLWLVTRLSAKPVNESAVLKLLCALLLAESLLFAAIAFSKLALYISCFGFTPRRLQSSWLVCVLAAGCVSALYSLLSGKKSFLFWLLLSAVSLAFLHLY